MARTFYVLHTMTRVDHPELRGPGYYSTPSVNDVLNTSWQYETLGAALAERQGVLAGEYDFGSEYMYRCWIMRHTVRPDGSMSFACARDTMERADREDPWHKVKR